jgi:hypothetical protein
MVKNDRLRRRKEEKMEGRRTRKVGKKKRKEKMKTGIK